MGINTKLLWAFQDATAASTPSDCKFIVRVQICSNAYPSKQHAIPRTRLLLSRVEIPGSWSKRAGSDRGWSPVLGWLSLTSLWKCFLWFSNFRRDQEWEHWVRPPKCAGRWCYEWREDLLGDGNQGVPGWAGYRRGGGTLRTNTGKSLFRWTNPLVSRSDNFTKHPTVINLRARKQLVNIVWKSYYAAGGEGGTTLDEDNLRTLATTLMTSTEYKLVPY